MVNFWAQEKRAAFRWEDEDDSFILSVIDLFIARLFANDLFTILIDDNSSSAVFVADCFAVNWQKWTELSSFDSILAYQLIVSQPLVSFSWAALVEIVSSISVPLSKNNWCYRISWKAIHSNPSIHPVLYPLSFVLSVLVTEWSEHLPSETPRSCATPRNRAPPCHPWDQQPAQISKRRSEWRSTMMPDWK